MTATIRPRIYADTSVIGGCLDEEFSNWSLHFVERVRSGTLQMVLSDLTLLELSRAPLAV